MAPPLIFTHSLDILLHDMHEFTVINTHNAPREEKKERKTARKKKERRNPGTNLIDFPLY